MSEQRGHGRATWWSAVAALAVLTAITAVISYEHAYEVFSAAHNTGSLAILGPVVPDLVIAVCSMALLASAGQQGKRPGVAYAALFVFIGVTIALNVAAGLRFGRGSALLAALAPVGYLTGLHILAGMIRRGRGGESPALVLAAAAPCEHEPALSLVEALTAARPHMTLDELAEGFEMSKATVRRRLARAEPAAPELVTVSANGQAPHE